MILVIGGAGYIGSHMAKLLRHSGEPHIVLDNMATGHPASVKGSELIVGDIHDRPLMRQILSQRNVDTVIHFAAFSLVGESASKPADYWRNNFVGTFELLEAMRDTGVSKLVFSSTAAVFGEPNEVPIPESHPTKPTNTYGDTKLAVESLLASYDRAYGMRSVALRYFNAAGADPEGEIGEDHRPETHLIPAAMLSAMGKAPAMKLFGTDYDTPDGTCVRDYIHVNDLGSAHQLAVQHLRGGGDSRRYNLGNGTGFSVREVLDTVSAVVGRPVPYEEAARRVGDPARLVAASEAIRRDFGWMPLYPDLRPIVEHAWAWRQAFPDGYPDA